jgi:hypothetical protein
MLSAKWNPKKIRVFSIAYILALLICVLFHIESWPFSDYKVFSTSKKLSQIKGYKLGVYDEDGKVLWLFEGRKNKVIYSKTIRLIKKYPQKLDEYLKSYVPTAINKFGKNLKELILFTHIVEMKESKIQITPKPLKIFKI